MRPIAVLLLSFALAPSQAQYRHNGEVFLPDPRYTPGDMLSVTKDDICKPGYAGKVRLVNRSLKNKVYLEYGVDPAKPFSAANVVTGPAGSSPVASNPGIGSIEWMPIDAMGPSRLLGYKTPSSQDINARRDGLKMIRIYAMSIPAEMVEMFTWGDWSFEGLENHYVRSSLPIASVSSAYHAVSGPFPASAIPIDGDPVGENPIEGPENYSHDSSYYEIDHLVSLELGGSNDIKNLWPQPYLPKPGAHEKDKLENLLHIDVCKGYIPLATAQKRIATDWYQTYLLSGLDKKSSQTVSGTHFTISTAPLLRSSGEPLKKQLVLR